MQIERRYTEPGGDPYAGVEFAERTSAHRQSGRLRRLRGNAAGPGQVVPGRGRHPGAEVLPQGGRRDRARARPGGRRARVAGARPSRRAGSPVEGRDRRAPGVPPSRRLLDLLGLHARVLRRGGRARVLRRAAGHARPPGRRAQLAAVVQHGPELGVRHQRPAAGPLVRRARRRRAEAVHERLRAPCPARLLHPVRGRRPRQRGRHHGPVGARGPRLQVRLRHRLQLLRHPRRERAPVGRRPLVRPDELPEDRRPRRGRHQVGRHHAPRREDGDARPRPSRHPALRPLEGRRGDQGGRARGRLADALAAPQQRRHGHHRGRCRGRRAVRRADQPGAREGRPRRAPGRRARRLHPARARPRPPGRHASCTSTSTTPTGRARRTTPSPARTRTTPSASRPTSCAPSRATTTGTCTTAPSARTRSSRAGRPAPSSTLRARELWDDIAETAWLCADPGLQFHDTTNEWHTCPADGAIRASNPCAEYVFLDDTACNLASLNLLEFETADGFDVELFRHGVAAVDGRARDLGADGAVPVQGDRAAAATPTARSAWATPTWARSPCAAACRTTRPRPPRCAAR